jgi:hypothetical protein
MFCVITVGFLLTAPIAAQAQGVPQGMNYGAHRGAYTGYGVLGPVGGFVGGVVGGAAGGVVGGVNGMFGINPHPHSYYRRYRRLPSKRKRSRGSGGWLKGQERALYPVKDANP